MVLVGTFAVSVGLRGSTSDTFSVPGTESQRADALLAAKFPGTGGASMMVIPAAHRLLGDNAWWMPGPLERHLPRVDIEGASLPEARRGHG